MKTKGEFFNKCVYLITNCLKALHVFFFNFCSLQYLDKKFLKLNFSRNGSYFLTQLTEIFDQQCWYSNIISCLCQKQKKISASIRKIRQISVPFTSFVRERLENHVQKNRSVLRPINKISVALKIIRPQHPETPRCRKIYCQL